MKECANVDCRRTFRENRSNQQYCQDSCRWHDRDRERIRSRINSTLGRPFIAWDGEGITYPGQKQQSYVLFAASTGSGYDRYVRAREGSSLTTEQCLNLMFEVEDQFPNAYHIGFGFGYDTNQILNSLSRGNIYGLAGSVKRGRTYYWKQYRIKIHPGKLFRVSKGKDNDFRCITIYDTFGFFQRRFIDVVKAYFPDELDRIESGKSDRGNFKYADINEITKYCLAENSLLVRIMDKLRNNFEERGLYLRDWHGPGAVANASLKRHNIKTCMGESPREVQLASQLAYQGGRFELIRAGYYNKKVWQYDINSAYPSAIVGLPNLSRGYWEYTETYEPETYSVWNVSYIDSRTYRYDKFCDFRAQPLFFRTSDGRVAYPPWVEGWYWSPEVDLLTKLDYPAKIEIKGGWVFREEEPDDKPFRYVEDIYYERLEMKKNGDGAERVLKLEMNSLYGKFAQRSGWFQHGDRIPSYHQLEWAGYITSSTRAKLWEAYNQSPGSILAFETDAIFSLRPLDLPTGENLGEWTQTEYTDILYLQSGFYFANSGGSQVSHYRGFDRGSLSFESVYEWLSKLDPRSLAYKERAKIFGPTKRFIGFKRALASRNPQYWRTWESSEREITIGRDGKRIHFPNCPLCIQGYGWHEGLHGLQTVLPGGPSQPHKIPWETQQWVENQWGEEKLVGSADGYDW